METLEDEVVKLLKTLCKEEENIAQRAEDISALQSELLQATQALEEPCEEKDQSQNFVYCIECEFN